MKKAVLLVNLGTPDDPSEGAVRRYLREFLSDPRVIDINPVGRALLLYLFILPFRPRRSAAAYRKIWSAAGSPLLAFSRAQAEALQARMPDVTVALAMRYGKPSIAGALAALCAQGVEALTVLPLYPQYSSAATGSSLEAILGRVRSWPSVPALCVAPEFYDHPGFLDAFAEVARPEIARFAPDHVLFSYHGLPERQLAVTPAAKAHCLKAPGCCDQITDANRRCYRAQCYATTRGLAARLGLDAAGHTTTFQSRLGRTPWIQPFTDVVLDDLARSGVKRLLVMCPSFVADCLETLEEVAIRARAQFIAAGGQDLALAPSLNAHPAWIAALERLCREAGRGGGAPLGSHT